MDSIMEDETNKYLWFICQIAMNSPILKADSKVVFNLPLVNEKFKSYEDYEYFM